jgi:tetratricopeptide (TPR) repeat protein
MAKRSKKKERPPQVDLAQKTVAQKIAAGKPSGFPWAMILLGFCRLERSATKSKDPFFGPEKGQTELILRQAQDDERRRKRVLQGSLQALVIAAAVLWIYWPELHGDWLWDDYVDITNNTVTQSPTGLWSIWFVPGSQFDYYPLKLSVQWLQWRLWGMDTLGYHLTNVLLHIVGALLVWRLLSKFGLRLAWLGGLIFAVHPVQVESVAWIAELKNTLSLPPFLLAMCAYIDYDERGKWGDYFLALGLFLVAMLCKATMVMFPAVILLYVWWKRGRIRWKDVLAGAPFFAVSLALGLLAIWFQHHIAMRQGTQLLGGIFSRLAGAGLSLSFYFSKCFLPVGLMPIYPKWAVDPPALWQFLPWPVLGGAFYWLWTRRRGWGRHALLGLGFFLLFLAPFLGFTTASYMAFTWVMDHFLYLPMIGLIGLVVAGFGEVGKQLPASFRFYGIGLVSVVPVLLVFQSHSYAKMFLNQETLWSYELLHNPNAYMAHNNLGLALFEKGELSEAITEYEESLRIDPDYYFAHNNLGNALKRAGRGPEAVAEYEQALRLNPDYAEPHYNLGNYLFQTGRLPEAIDQYEQALQIKPDYAEAHGNLGYALQHAGHWPEAREQYEEALRIKPDYAEAHYNLGNVFFQTGQLAAAMEQFGQALRSKPDYAEAHNNLGIALYRTGRVSEAVKQFEEALQIKPDFTEARDNLTKLQAFQQSVPAKN